MLRKSALKRVAIGMVAATAAMIGLASTAQAQEVTCVWYNSMYDFCTVRDWNPATMQYEVTEQYFKLREEYGHIDP